MASRPHLIYLVLDVEHISIRVECPGGADRDCKWYEEISCQCLATSTPCNACDDGDHAGCVVYGGELVGDFYRCQARLVSGRCALMEQDCTWEEMIGAGPWPIDEYPVRAAVDQVDGLPILVPWVGP